MKEQELRKLIENLHRELASAEAIDDESRALLKSLASDVEKVAGPEPTTDRDQASVADRLEKATVRFESEHPQLSMTLGELIDALGKLGI